MPELLRDEGIKAYACIAEEQVFIGVAYIDGALFIGNDEAQGFAYVQRNFQCPGQTVAAAQRQYGHRGIAAYKALRYFIDGAIAAHRHYGVNTIHNGFFCQVGAMPQVSQERDAHFKLVCRQILADGFFQPFFSIGTRFAVDDK